MGRPIEVEIKNLISTNKFGGGVFLGNEDKTFAIFIGPDEMNALVLAGQGIDPPRPLTHNLIQSILLGFDIDLERAIVSDLVDETFTATLILEREPDDDETPRHEVRIDCRPSDAMVLATLSDRPIYVEPHVFDEVDDQRELLEALKAQVMEEIQKKVSTFQKGEGEGEPDEETSASNRVAEFLDPSDVEEFEGIEGIEDLDLDVDLDPGLDLEDDEDE